MLDERPARALRPAQGCHHGAVTRGIAWESARRVAGESATALPAVARPLAAAAGHALAAQVRALTDLPAFDTSAMDGWAVAGPGPWTLAGGGVPVGEVPGPLAAGTAIRIATGAPVPPGASAVLRLEDGVVAGGVLRCGRPLPDGRDIRPRGQECVAGMVLIDAGATVTPAALALAAAAGHDELRVHRQPSVRLLVTGGELLDAGVPRDGQVRDALGPMILPWLAAQGAMVQGRRLIADQAETLLDEALRGPADVLITTGGTSVGQTDLLHGVLREVGARLAVDSVAVRPGHPMLLAELPPRPSAPLGGHPRWLVGLPGNPLAAIVGLVTLAQPLLRRLGGHSVRAARYLPASVAIGGHPRDTRLVPALDRDGRAVPLPFDGPAMLRGIAAADVIAVIPPGGTPAGIPVEVIAI